MSVIFFKMHCLLGFLPQHLSMISWLILGDEFLKAIFHDVGIAKEWLVWVFTRGSMLRTCLTLSKK